MKTEIPLHLIQVVSYYSPNNLTLFENESLAGIDTDLLAEEVLDRVDDLIIPAKRIDATVSVFIGAVITDADIEGDEDYRRVSPKACHDIASYVREFITLVNPAKLCKLVDVDVRPALTAEGINSWWPVMVSYNP